MQLLELTLPSPAANLALDEALLLEAEAAEVPQETFRLWEPAEPMIVVGSSTKVAEEVDLMQAEKLGIPVLRRPSGGLTIVTGPGCLMYSLVLSYRLRPQLRSLDEAHRYVLDRIAKAIQTKAPGIQRRGISDLAIAERKISGNSVRCKRDNMLYHGTLLYDFPLAVISQCLKRPPRQPEYRENRDHASFVDNLRVPGSELRVAIKRAFAASESRSGWPAEETARLVGEKYSRREWNYRS